LRALDSLIAAAAGVLSAYAVVEWWLWRRGQFGRGDLSGFWFWNAVFAVCLLASGLLLAKFASRRGWLGRLFMAVGLGAPLGFLFTLANRFLLGPWFGAWSFPVLYAWVAGGMASFAVLGLLLRTTASPNATGRPTSPST